MMNEITYQKKITKFISNARPGNSSTKRGKKSVQNNTIELLNRKEMV